MYTVFATIKANNTWVKSLFYHPKMINDGYVIYNPVLTIEDNKAGSFQFKLPVTNNLYNNLSKMKSIITVYSDSEMIFRGRILNDERDFNNNKLVYCEGELAFLIDSIVRPFKQKGTVKDVFTSLINSHNSQVDSDHQFTVGTVNVLGDEEIEVDITEYQSTLNAINSYLVSAYDGHLRIRHDNETTYIDYITAYTNENTQEVVFGRNLLDITQYISAENIITRLIPLGKSIPVDLTDEEIGLPKDIASGTTEDIKNKADNNDSKFVFSCDVKMTAVNRSDPEKPKCTITVTYKGKLSVGNSISWSGLDGNKIYADIKLNGKDIKKESKASFSFTPEFKTILEYTGEVDMTNTTVTCEFVNQYTTKDTKPISNSMAVVANLVQQKYVRTTIASVNNNLDYIENANAIEQFGLITATNVWDDEENPAKLKTKAEEYLAKNIEMNVSLEVSAIDLSMLGASPEKFKMGDLVRVISAPHGITGENLFTITKVSLDLQNPENNEYSMGVSYTTLTETQVNTQNHIQLTADQLATIVNDVNYQYTVTEQVSALVEQVYDHYADIQTVIDNLSVTYADIDFANIGTASVKNLFADKAVLTEAEIAALQAESASISQILAKGLTANTAFIDNLIASTAFIDNLTTDHLDAKYLAADFANLTQASVNSLFSKEIFTDKLSAGYVEAGFANIGAAEINTLTANTTFTQFLTGNYASLNLANVRNLNAKDFFANSGIMKDLQVSDQYVTGNLNAVYLKGDTIEANTLKADRLIVKGNDGFYYQMNVVAHEDGRISETEWTRIQNEGVKEALHGTNIIARSVTADRIAAKSITANELAVSITGEDYESGTTLMSLKAGVEGVATTVANWRVGGRNLLRNSRLYKSPLADIEGAEHPKAWGANGGTTFLDYVEGEATRVVNFSTVTANTWREIESYPKMLYSRIRNQTVTVSCEVWAESGADCGMNFCLFLCNSEEDSRKKYRNYYKYFTGTSDWQKIYVTLDITDAWFTAGTDITVGYDSAYFGLRPGAISSKWAGYKARCFMVELGNTPTDWTQAPEDGEEYTNTIIDQRKDEIVLAAHKYTKVGGTNLLLKTPSDWSDWRTPPANSTNYTAFLHSTSGDYMSYFEPGTEFTLSFDIEFADAKPGTSGTAHRLYPQGAFTANDETTDWNHQIKWVDQDGALFNLPVADGVYHVSVTAKNTYDYTDFARYFINFRTDNWDGVGKFRVRKIKLEVGNTETVWSPAPDDNRSYADDKYAVLNESVLNIWPNEISSKVSEFLTNGKYQTKDDVSKALSGYAKTTDIKQTAENVTISVINGEVDSAKLPDGTSYLDALKAGADANDILKNQYNTYFNFSDDGLKISKTGSSYYALYTESDLQFKHGDTVLGRFGTEGLSTTELQVGNMSTAQKRWRIIVNSDGTHLRITRHQ